MKTYKICGHCFPQDLYLLVNKYADPGIKGEFLSNPNQENIEKFINSGIEQSKLIIPDLYDETREYPPFLYYTILSYLDTKKPGTRWRDMTKEEKEGIVGETYGWIKELKGEVK